LVFSSYLIDIAPILPNKGSAHKTGDGSLGVRQSFALPA